MHTKRNRQRSLFVCQAGLIAALYATLTLVSSALGLGSGALQIRISEALCILPVLCPAAIPGLAVGCLVGNLFSGCIWQDVVFGTSATLIGACGAYLLRRRKWLAPLPAVAANTVIIPLVLAYGYGFAEGVGYMMLTVGLGELLSAYLCGLLLLQALYPHRQRIFRT